METEWLKIGMIVLVVLLLTAIYCFSPLWVLNIFLRCLEKRDKNLTNKGGKKWQ